MTPTQFKTIRTNASLSVDELAKVLRLSDGRSVRRYESGDRAISGPIEKLMEILDSGDFPFDEGV